jgi:hypothetical protein
MAITITIIIVIITIIHFIYFNFMFIILTNFKFTNYYYPTKFYQILLQTLFFIMAYLIN